AGTVDVVVDVVGWFSDSSAAAAATGRFIGLAPARILDTRSSGGPLSAGSRIFAVAGQGGIPSMSDAAPPTAVVLNVTVVSPQAAGFFTLYASGTAQPQTSDVNFPAGALLSNLVIVKLGADGNVAIYN